MTGLLLVLLAIGALGAGFLWWVRWHESQHRYLPQAEARSNNCKIVPGPWLPDPGAYLKEQAEMDLPGGVA